MPDARTSANFSRWSSLSAMGKPAPFGSKRLKHTTEEATPDFPCTHISLLEKPMVANLHVAGLWLMR